MINVFVVDDHSVVREGIKKIFQGSNSIKYIGEADSCKSAIKWLKNNKADVVLLDIELPDKDGLEVLKTIRANHPNLPVLIFTLHNEQPMAHRYIKSGANGYITKDSSSKEIIKAICHIKNGKNYLNSITTKIILNDLENETDALAHTSLSEREFTVLRLIGSGNSVGQIAEILNLSSRTISTYRTRILTKMQLKNNAEITYYVVNNKLNTK
ncbi:MAG: response regulator transcription factor [Magnetococcales bacterium]|nr:response regulator transcription factor [Magnetococcales bacterium]